MAREEKGKEKEKEKKKRDREKEEGKSGEMGPGSRTVGQRKESQQMQNSSSSASSVVASSAGFSLLSWSVTMILTPSLASSSVVAGLSAK